MVRLNDKVTQELVDRLGCPPLQMETFLRSIRLLLWPVFQKALSLEADHLRKLGSGAATPQTTTASSMMTGMFSSAMSSKSTSREAALKASLDGYTNLFLAAVALCPPSDEEMVFTRCARALFSSMCEP